MGYFSIKKGEREKSVVLISSGKHLQSDTWTTLGVVISLVLVYFTKIYWIDAAVALVFGFYIIFVGLQNRKKITQWNNGRSRPRFIESCSRSFSPKTEKKNGLDIHNMKIQQYGSGLHIDAHITLPWYNTLRESHQEMENIIKTLAIRNRKTRRV